MSLNSTLKTGMKKIIFTFITQGIIVLLSVITSFILPRVMGPETFGYWQVYLFYLAYVPMLGLGYNDGIVLSYGGRKLDELPATVFRSAIRAYSIYLCALTLLLLGVSLCVPNWENGFIFFYLILSVPLICLQCVVLSSMLAVNKTGTYNLLNLFNRVLAVALYAVLLLAGIFGYKEMIFADFCAKILMTIACLFVGRKLVFGKSAGARVGIKEVSEKSRFGFKLTLAIVASMLIPVVGRTVVEMNESKTAYGLYSFAMTLLTVILTFTNAFGTVIFPMLKKHDDKILSGMYYSFTLISNTLIFVALIAYIPLWFVVNSFLKEYIPVFAYAFILLAMCVPLGKMQLITITYYKIFRLEKQLLWLNCAGVLAMLSTTMISYFIARSVISVAISTTIVMVLFSVVMEYILCKKIKIKYQAKELFFEVAMMFVFVIAASAGSISIFAIVYLVAIAVYFVIRGKSLKTILKTVRG